MALGKGFDTPRVHDLMPIANTFVQDGYTFVCGYYFEHSAFKQLLNKATAQTLSQSGLWIVSIFEDGFPTRSQYFTAAQGHLDASRAYLFALAAGQPQGTPVFFAADGDFDKGEVDAYFQAVQAYLKPKGFLVGCYGSGLICESMVNAGYVSHTWLSGSRGWQGYHRWLPNANIVQELMDTHLHGLPCDTDSTSGNGGGWRI